jgi:phage baseplate assembly protein gpV
LSAYINSVGATVRPAVFSAIVSSYYSVFAALVAANDTICPTIDTAIVTTISFTDKTAFKYSDNATLWTTQSMSIRAADFEAVDGSVFSAVVVSLEATELPAEHCPIESAE